MLCLGVLMWLRFGTDSVDAPLGPTMYDDGTYKFLRVQKYDPTVPVSYNQCQPIDVVMNPLGAPPEAEKVLRLAIRDVERATGIEFRYKGRSNLRPTVKRTRGPILVTWTDEEEVASMTDRVAGLGGSGYIAYDGERAYYSTGQIILSADTYDRLHRSGDVDSMRATLDHEFGHVMGLGHVDDENELMAPTRGNVERFGHGDLTGLAILGTQPC